ncbi:MAG: hypothetical protein DRN20_06180 [Thermoplasmata archaeon]|nr:MAG: hypothetical protein DRN20_06180 [Thermoplasmata archaeon]
MVRVGEVYGRGNTGRFLNAAICEEEGLWDTPLTIEKVELREINNRQKLVVHFRDIDDVLVLNRTNALIIAEKYGEETDEWAGKTIILKKTKRSFRGKLVDAIEVQTVDEEQDLSKENGKKGKKGKKGR